MFKQLLAYTMPSLDPEIKYKQKVCMLKQQVFCFFSIFFLIIIFQRLIKENFNQIQF